MKTLISSLFLILCGISLMAQTPVDLKLNLEKGKVYTIKSTSKQKIQQTASGQQYALDVYSNRVISYKVLKQENDIMDIEFKFDTIASKISSPMFNKETNSTKPGKEPVELIMNKMSTYKLIAKISTGGKFIDFVNYGNYRDNIMFVIDSIPATKRDDARKQADVLLKESAVKSMVEPFFAYLPDKTVKIGDTWETSFISTSNDVSSVVLNSYTLKGVENNVATVSGKSEIESMPSNDPSAQTSMELKGTSTFEGNMDIITGLVLKGTENSHFDGTATTMNNGSEMKVQIQIDSQSETMMTK